MPQVVIQKLRQRQATVRLPDGSEGVPVTLQFRGTVPALDRAARKRWLGEQFNSIGGRFGSSGLVLKLDTVSPSAQTVEALCPIEGIDAVTRLAEASGLRLDVSSNLQVL